MPPWGGAQLKHRYQALQILSESFFSSWCIFNEVQENCSRVFLCLSTRDLYVAIRSKKMLTSLCFNRAPRPEGVLGEWLYSSRYSLPRHYMEASGQLHAPTALPPGKEPLVLKGFTRNR
jgi:hypothetical protein